MSRHHFEAYLDKVFDFSQRVGALPEGRHSPAHPWPKVFEAVFLGAAMQIPSLLQIEAECRRGVLTKRIGHISDDTFGYALQRQSPEPVFALGCDIARRLKRNGVLRSEWSRGLVVAAVDGIEICSSFARCCDACMQREVQHKVRGELRTDIQYYHRIVAAVIVSTPFPVPLGIRFQKDGEAEVPCALALLRDLVDQLGRRFLDLVVGDAIYLQAPFVKEVEALGLDWAFTLKENQGSRTALLALARGRLARGGTCDPRSENRAHGSQTRGHRQSGRRPRQENQEPGGSREHELLRHEFRTRRDPAAVHLSTEPQPVAH
ncbi:MAG: transposase [Acidobacteriia bacterium]|nr:transposase [Terriglobia bacterium]